MDRFAVHRLLFIKRYGPRRYSLCVLCELRGLDPRFGLVGDILVFWRDLNDF